VNPEAILDFALHAPYLTTSSSLPSPPFSNPILSQICAHARNVYQSNYVIYWRSIPIFGNKHRHMLPLTGPCAPGALSIGCVVSHMRTRHTSLCFSDASRHYLVQMMAIWSALGDVALYSTLAPFHKVTMSLLAWKEESFDYYTTQRNYWLPLSQEIQWTEVCHALISC